MASNIDLFLFLLNQTNELARKLSENLDPSRIEICRTIASEIISSNEKALCTAKSLAFSNVGGIYTEKLNPEFRDKEQKRYKRRKILANTTRQEIVCTDGADVPPNDGQSWRKYGQKDILGAKYPRSYYRCTYQKSEGCSAMKQVQKSDENPSIINITYLGTHTCSVSPQQETTSCFNNPQNNLFDKHNRFFLPSDFQFNLQVNTESSYFENQDPTTSFSFSSKPIEETNLETALLCSSSNMECDFEGTLKAYFMSPTRFGSNSYSPYEMNSQEDSGLADLISATNSLMNSPELDLEFVLENGEIDTETNFDTSIFFNEGNYSLCD